jgi:hypothetical protein
MSLILIEFAETERNREKNDDEEDNELDIPR